VDDELLLDDKVRDDLDDIDLEVVFSGKNKSDPNPQPDWIQFEPTLIPSASFSTITPNL
jgi:hypothetical protein